MRILEYLSGFRTEYGGPVESVSHLCSGLALLGHDVVILSRDLTDLPRGWREADATQRSAYALTVPGWIIGQRSTTINLVRLVATCEVVHIHSFWDPGAVAVGLAAVCAGVPYVLSPRGSLDVWSLSQKSLKKQMFLAAVGRRLIQRADVLHFTASAESRQADSVATIRRGVVIPNPIDLDEFEPASELADAPTPVPSVLFLSRLHPKKGLEHLIDATSILHTAGVGLRVIVAGTGDPTYESRIRNRSEELGLQGIVEFVGDVRGHRRSCLYRAADLFVLPTSSENFGRVLFEAMACGTPVLTTSGVDAVDLLLESGGAVIVEQDSGLIAKEMERLLSNPWALRDMGLSGSEWVRRELGHKSVAQAYLDMYASLSRTGHHVADN